MTVFALITVDEFQIARDGEIPEPSFRPWPGSKRDREMDSEAGERSNGSSGRNSKGAQVTEAAADPRIFINREGVVLSRQVAAQATRRHLLTGAVFVTLLNGVHSIVGLGSVAGSTRATAWRGVRNVEYHVSRTFAEPVLWNDSLGELPPPAGSDLLSKIDAGFRPSVPEEMMTALNSLRAGTSQELLAILSDAQSAQSRKSKRRIFDGAREAASTSLHLFTSQWHRLEPSAHPAPTGFALTAESLVSGLESDAITDDASVFPGWDRATYSRGGWWEFHSGRRRLLVKNINASPAETRTGADLVYVKRDPNLVVLVQYKMTTTLEDGRAIYRPDGRLPSQVKRLTKYDEIDPGVIELNNLEAYRLAPGFTFVKFVDPDARVLDRPGELTPGRYMPTDLVRRMLANPSLGPRNGTIHYIEEQRSMPSDLFASLVRGSWIGSTGEATEQLLKILGLTDDKNIVLAVDEPSPRE